MLIIDDDEFSHLIVSEELRSKGVDVATAPDDDAANLLLGSRQYSVVVVDPFRAGCDPEDLQSLIERIRKTNKSAAIVIFTSYRSPTFASWVESGEVAAVIEKRQARERSAQRLLEIWKDRQSR